MFKPLLKLQVFSCLFSLVFSGVGCTNQILRASDSSSAAFPEFVAELKDARLVFVGELHDRKEHHDAQLRVTQALKDAGLPVAIGLEMFQSRDQRILDKWISGEVGLDEFQKVYHSNWKIPWPLYSDILLYARENKIPLIGLNIQPDIIRQVAAEGFASLQHNQVFWHTKGLPPISCDVSPRYEKFIRKAMGAHAKDGRSFKNFCEAQVLRDTFMALNLVNFLKNNPDYTVVVLAGNTHSWKHGIPEQVKRLSVAGLKTKVMLLGPVEELGVDDIATDDTDYLWLGL